MLLIDIQPHANSYVNVVLATPEREMVLKKISSSMQHRFAMVDFIDLPGRFAMVDFIDLPW